MAKTVQTNVRVIETDRVLIVTLAQRLRNDPGFRERVKALLDNDSDPALSDRVKKLEQQVSWLASGAIVVPRTTPRIGNNPGRSPTR